MAEVEAKAAKTAERLQAAKEAAKRGVAERQQLSAAFDHQRKRSEQELVRLKERLQKLLAAKNNGARACAPGGPGAGA